MLRLFIATELPAPAQEALAATTRRLAGLWAADAVRWTPAGNHHQTLRFLGATEDARVDGLRAGLDGVAAGGRRLELALAGVGAFPDPRRPRVLWVGLQGEDVDALVQLQRQVEYRVRAAGWPPEPKTFHPHLTLGRVRAQARPPQADWTATPVPAAAVPVSALVLVSSDLRPTGAVYTCLHRAALPF